MSDVNRYLRVEDLRWNTLNESTTFQESVENYCKAYGHYPEHVLADTIFRTRENLRYCKERDIHLNGQNLENQLLTWHPESKNSIWNGSNPASVETLKDGSGLTRDATLSVASPLSFSTQAKL